MTSKATADVRIRAVAPDELEVCAALDHSNDTDFVWQMELIRADNGDETSVHFRTVRLPRSMKVRYPRDASTRLRSWQLDACFLVAQLGGEIVGYISMRKPLAKQQGWVADLAVRRAHRRQGIGGHLFHAAREWARTKGLHRIIVETTTKNYPAITFLRKNGLVYCGYNDLYYSNQDIAIFFGQRLQ